ncbi:MAG: histidine phosphatase family protein, partial [Marinobacter sp.]|nr:histidine phosphatase family protein [Marinobacter sp.]
KADFRDYWQTFRAAYEAWIDNRIESIEETWSDFGERIDAALAEALAGRSRDEAVLVVTSGGVIGRTVNQLLKGPAATAIELNFQFRNAAFCEVIVGRSAQRLLSYNSIPHLDRPGRRDAITHV